MRIAISPGDAQPASTRHKVTGFHMVPAQYQPLIDRAAAQYGVPADHLARMLRRESGFRPEVIDGRTVSSAGAQGIAQFMPGTAKEQGVDPLNPESAIPGAARYLAQLQKQFGGNLEHATAAYNWGPGNLQKWLAAGGDPTGMPAETQAYLKAVMQGGQAPAGTPQAAPSAPGAPMALTGAAPAGGLPGGLLAALGQQQQQGGMNQAAQGLLAMNAAPKVAQLEAPPPPQPYRPRVDLTRLQQMLRQG
jgi:hypothetical protein